MAASKTASNRAQRTDVVLHASDRPKSSRLARFFDGGFVHQGRSATDAESEPRVTPRPSYRLRKPGGGQPRAKAATPRTWGRPPSSPQSPGGLGPASQR
jgi:hypothetical protein